MRQTTPKRSDTASPAPPAGTSTPTKTDAFNISNEDAIRRLRAKGQTIRLFAETDKERRLRLGALEVIEERGGEKGAGQNDFRRVMEGMEQGLNVEEVEKKLAGDTKGKG